jgi:hypothetical protein
MLEIHANRVQQKDTNNIIQGLWIGPRLSRFEHNSIKSYLKQGYEYHLYTYGKVDNIPDGVIIKDGNEILDKKYIFHYEGSIAPFSDLFRYKLLFERGGVWTDCDIICVKRLPDDTQHKYIFVAERTILKGAFASCIKTPPYTCKKKKVLNSFIRTPQYAPIMLQMFDKSLKYRDEYLKSKRKSSISSKSSKSYNTNSRKQSRKHSKTIKHHHAHGLKPNIGLKSYHWGGGSKTLETLITKYQLEDYVVEPEFAFPINWWDFKHAFENIEYIAPSRGWSEGTYINDIFKKSSPIYLVTIHNGWLKNHNVDKNAKYHENSLFERLDRYIK